MTTTNELTTYTAKISVKDSYDTYDMRFEAEDMAHAVEQAEDAVIDYKDESVFAVHRGRTTFYDVDDLVYATTINYVEAMFEEAGLDPKLARDYQESIEKGLSWGASDMIWEAISDQILDIKIELEGAV